MRVVKFEKRRDFGVFFSLTVALLAGIFPPLYAGSIPEGDTPATIFRVSSTNSGAWWEYSYHGNDFPYNVSSGWQKVVAGTPSETLTASGTNRFLRIATPLAGQSLYYYWQGIPNIPDREGGFGGGAFSPVNWQAATVEWRLKVNAMNPGASAAQYFYLNTVDKSFGIQLTTTTIRWMDGSAISGLPSGFNPMNFNSYRLVYTHSSSNAALYINNSPTAVAIGAGSPRVGSVNTIYWGDTSGHASVGGDAEWDYVRFARGAYAPAELGVVLSKRFLSIGGVAVAIDVSSSEKVSVGDTVNSRITTDPGGTVIDTQSDTVDDRFEPLLYIVDLQSHPVGNYRWTSDLIKGGVTIGTSSVGFTKPEIPSWAK